MSAPHSRMAHGADERQLMSVDPTKPGLLESLRGEGGEAWPLFVTVGICLLIVLPATGFLVAARNAFG